MAFINEEIHKKSVLPWMCPNKLLYDKTVWHHQLQRGHACLQIMCTTEHFVDLISRLDKSTDAKSVCLEVPSSVPPSFLFPGLLNHVTDLEHLLEPFRSKCGKEGN